MSLRRLFLYRHSFLELLLSCNPSALDVFLLFAGTAGAIAGGLVYPFLGLMFGRLVDDLSSSSCGAGNPHQANQDVRQRVLIVAFIALAQFVVIYAYMGCWTLFGERLTHRLRTRYLAALLRQEPAYFDRLPPGEVSARLDSDLQTIQTGTSEKVGLCITSFSYFFAAYIVAFILDAKLAILMSSLVPAYLFMTAIGDRFTNKFSSRVTARVSMATSIASECLLNMTVVKSFRAERRLEHIFASNLIQVQRPAIAKAVAAAIQLGSLHFISHAANALAVYQGSKQIAASAAGQKELTVGQIYTVIFVLVDASFVITRVAPFFHLFSAAASASQQLFAVMEREPTIDGTALHTGGTLDTVIGDIKVQHASFRYPARKEIPVLDDVSFDIPAGKLIALVGGSGSGKSTLAMLIPRLYDLDAGRILLDGIDIQALNVRFLRSQVAVVEQNPTLLECSVLENIAFGLVGSMKTELYGMQTKILDGSLAGLASAVREGANLESMLSLDPTLCDIVGRVRRAMALVGGMHFVFEFEHGISTVVGSKGRQLSGGQCQRVAIARALVRDVQVLILDEATSSLDSFGERELQASLDSAFKGKTIVWIAHRLSTVKNAASIIVMQDGHVIEQGTYHDLMEHNGSFAAMVRMQHLHSLEKVQALESSSTLSTRSDLTPTTASKQNEGWVRDTDDWASESDSEDVPLLSVDHGTNDPSAFSGSSASMSIRSVFRRILALIQSERLYLIAGITAAAIVGFEHPGNALIFGNMIGHLSPCQPEEALQQSGKLFASLFIGLAVLELSASSARGFFFGIMAETLLLRIRVLTFRSLLHQDIAWHESGNRSPNTLLSFLTTDAVSVSGMTGTIMGVIFSIIISIGAGIVLSHIIAWKIAIVLLSAVPVMLLCGYLRLRMLARFDEKHHRAFALSVAIAKDAVESMRTVALFSLESARLKAYERSLQAPYSEVLRSIVFSNFWLALSYSVVNLIYALAYWWGFKLISSGTYTQTQFFIVLPALLISAQNCGQLFSLSPDVAKAYVATKRILAQLDLGPEDKSMPEHLGRTDQTGDTEASIAMQTIPAHVKHGASVSLKDVYFSYPARPNATVLNGMNLEIKQNQFAALVGLSGSGKSTVFALLERFYSPTSGSVSIDGRDIALSRDPSFRDSISIVPQENILFNESIRFNIALGARPGQSVSDEDIEDACQQANVHDVVTSLPQRYDTYCGPNGVMLSGGQRQRLAIARALVRKPNLLLLDESTSALDAESEKAWQDNLDKIARTTTVIAIAHRLTTIRKADLIFLIDKGRCVDKGTHKELFERNSFYKSSVWHQSFQ